MAVEIIRKCGSCGAVYSPMRFEECPTPVCRAERRRERRREMIRALVEKVRFW